MAVLKGAAPLRKIGPPKVDKPNYSSLSPDTLLPSRGVPVYVDHPIFEADEFLATRVTLAGLDYIVGTHERRDKAELKAQRDWIFGLASIPADKLERRLGVRKKREVRTGVSLPPVRQLSADYKICPAVERVDKLLATDFDDAQDELAALGVAAEQCSPRMCGEERCAYLVRLMKQVIINESDCVGTLPDASASASSTDLASASAA